MMDACMHQPHTYIVLVLYCAGASFLRTELKERERFTAATDTELVEHDDHDYEGLAYRLQEADQTGACVAQLIDVLRSAVCNGVMKRGRRQLEDGRTQHDYIHLQQHCDLCKLKIPLSRVRSCSVVQIAYRVARTRTVGTNVPKSQELPLLPKMQKTPRKSNTSPKTMPNKARRVKTKRIDIQNTPQFPPFPVPS